MKILRATRRLVLIAAIASIAACSTTEGITEAFDLSPSSTPVAGPLISLGRDVKDATYEVPGRVVHSFLNAEERQSTPQQRQADRQALRRLEHELPASAETRAENRREAREAMMRNDALR